MKPCFRTISTPLGLLAFMFFLRIITSRDAHCEQLNSFAVHAFAWFQPKYPVTFHILNHIHTHTLSLGWINCEVCNGVEGFWVACGSMGACCHVAGGCCNAIWLSRKAMEMPFKHAGDLLRFCRTHCIKKLEAATKFSTLHTHVGLRQQPQTNIFNF